MAISVCSINKRLFHCPSPVRSHKLITQSKRCYQSICNYISHSSCSSRSKWWKTIHLFMPSVVKPGYYNSIMMSTRKTLNVWHLFKWIKCGISCLCHLERHTPPDSCVRVFLLFFLSLLFIVRVEWYTVSLSVYFVFSLLPCCVGAEREGPAGKVSYSLLHVYRLWKPAEEITSAQPCQTRQFGGITTVSHSSFLHSYWLLTTRRFNSVSFVRT